MTAHRLQGIGSGLRLDHLRYRREAEARGELHHRRSEAHAAMLRGTCADPRPVDFDVIEGKELQVIEGGVPRTEVIEHDSTPVWCSRSSVSRAATTLLMRPPSVSSNLSAWGGTAISAS